MNVRCVALFECIMKEGLRKQDMIYQAKGQVCGQLYFSFFLYLYSLLKDLNKMHTILVENVSNFLDQNTHIFTYFISANHGSLVRRVVCVITICRFLFTPIARSFCVSLFSIRVCCELVGSLLSHSFSCVCLTTRTLHMVCSQCV